MKTIKYYLLFFFIYITVNHAKALDNIPMTIDEAAKKGFIKLNIKSKGGYTGKVIEMKIKNNSPSTLKLRLEAGRRLDSKKQNEQDILVTEARELIVSGLKEQSTDINGMCCQAGNACPSVNAEYSIGFMADSNLIKLAKFIDSNKYYNENTAQQAVWCVSDGKSIAGIYGGDKKIVEQLRNYVSLITGQPIPPYNITYKESDNNSTIGHPFKIEGQFNYELNTTGHVTLAIYDVNGNMVQLIFQDIAHNRGAHIIYYTFRTKDLPSGTYYARMTNEGRLEKETKIVF